MAILPTAKLPVLKWKTFSARGEPVAHVIVHHLLPGYVQAMHQHDFAEVFWCAEGSCLHIVNGHELRFAEGDLVMIRPHDAHELRAGDKQDCIYYLVSFPNPVFLHMRTAYSAAVPGFWGGKDELPRIHALSPLQRDWFATAFQELQADAQNRLLLDRFLINLTHELRESRRDPYANCPLWLQQALRELRIGQRFAEGVNALASISGRSREHVARVLKKHCGQSTSEAVNWARIEYAASRLVLSSDPIAKIALDCGFASLGHFYREFSRRVKVSPRRYRNQHSTMEKASQLE